jgi:hypothetical protein
MWSTGGGTVSSPQLILAMSTSKLDASKEWHRDKKYIMVTAFN